MFNTLFLFPWRNEVVLIVFAILSTFVGTAGLSIIANGVAFALGEAEADLGKEKYNVLKKAGVGQSLEPT